MTKANTLFFPSLFTALFRLRDLPLPLLPSYQRRQLKYRKRYIFFPGTAIDRMMLPAWAWWWWRLTRYVCLCGKIGLCGEKGTTFTELISNQNWNELSWHSGALSIEVNTTCIPHEIKATFFCDFAHIFIDKEKGEKKRRQKMAFTCLMRDISIFWEKRVLLWFQIQRLSCDDNLVQGLAPQTHTTFYILLRREEKIFHFPSHKPHTLDFRHWFSVATAQRQENISISLNSAELWRRRRFRISHDSLLPSSRRVRSFGDLRFLNNENAAARLGMFTRRNWVNQISYNAH